MAGCDEWALFKAFEVLLCCSCLIYKWWTDEEASRLYFYLEKRSREWPLLKNVTWNQAGSWFADVTFGGYAIITIALLIAHIIGELRHTRKTETFLLGIGSLLFFGCGCMIITSFDNVPESLFDNAIILGLLAIITGFIFLIDIGCFNRRDREKISTQEKEYRMKRDTAIKPKEVKELKEKPPKAKQSDTVNGNVTQDKVMSELRSSIKKKKSQNESSHKVENEKQTKENVQYGRKNLENRGFGKKTAVDEHDNAYEYDEQSIKNYDESDSSDSDSANYERKSRGSQTGRSYILEEKRVTRIKSKDAETITDSVAEIQSAKVTTTSPNKSDSQTSEESYELHPPASSSYLLSKNGRKFQPILTNTRIERISQNAIELNENGSVPSSPQDPGYVLHTASKWPNTTPVAPQSFQQFKEKNKVLRPVHSAV